MVTHMADHRRPPAPSKKQTGANTVPGIPCYLLVDTQSVASLVLVLVGLMGSPSSLLDGDDNPSRNVA